MASFSNPMGPGVTAPDRTAAAALRSPRAVVSLLRGAAQAWVDDRAASLGASLAYYTLFSIAPLLLIVIAVAGALFGADAARGAIFDQLRGLLGADGAVAVEGLLESVRRHGQSTIGTVVGGALLLLGATTVLAELQAALDRIWQAPPPAGRPGWWLMLRTRLLSLGLLLGVGFLLTVSLVSSAALAAWGRWWAPAFGAWTALLEAANLTLGFAMTAALFAMIYKLLPSVRIAWRDVAVGAVFTAALFSIGRSLIGLYIGTSGVASGFGAAGSLVALLVWVYYSAQVFLFGAELTWVYARRHGSLRPATPAPQPAAPG